MRASTLSTFEAIILGIIQGLTEFLPVSSSGHLTLAQRLLGFNQLDRYILFDLVCHLGTLTAIFAVYFKEIRETLVNDRKKLLLILVATLPLFPLVFILKPIKTLFDQPQFLGYFFLMTALFLYVGIRFGKNCERPSHEKRRWKQALAIGFSQAFAILPGISRSGSTISCARVLGWSREDAVSFSFMLAIPTILGGTLLEGLHAYRDWGMTDPLPNAAYAYTAGFLTSMAVGYGALKLLVKLVQNDKLSFFVWYCLFIACLCFYTLR